jgi:hypothetical protein
MTLELRSGRQSGARHATHQPRKAGRNAPASVIGTFKAIRRLRFLDRDLPKNIAQCVQNGTAYLPIAGHVYFQ